MTEKEKRMTERLGGLVPCEAVLRVFLYQFDAYLTPDGRRRFL